MVESEDLDRIFDLLLIFLSIITAALFQYTCSIEPLEIQALNPSFSTQELYQEVNRYLMFYLRVYFIPIFVLIFLWLFKRLSFNMTMNKKHFFSEFCYIFAFNVLMMDIYVFLVSSFPSLSTIYDPLYWVVLILQFFLSCPFVYYYEKTSIPQDARTRWQKLKLIVWPILKKTYQVSLLAWIINLLILALNIVPFAR